MTTISCPRERTHTSWNYEEVVVGSNLYVTTNSENVRTNYLQQIEAPISDVHNICYGYVC